MPAITVRWRLRRKPESGMDAAVLPVRSGRTPAHIPGTFLAGVGFTGAAGDVAQLPGAPGEPVTVLLGLGPAAEPDPAAVRTAAAMLARAASSYRRLSIEVPEHELSPSGLAALVEGYLLGGYRFAGHRSAPQDAGARQQVDVIASESPQNLAALTAGQLAGGAVVLARDLVNEPGGVLTPRAFAGLAGQVAERTGLSCEVWHEDRITSERLGGLLGVSRGAHEPPRLVRLGYQPAGVPARGKVALVGKGVTFDAGGMSLKPTAQLVDMKADMAGAAAVLGAMSALSGLGCPVAVDGWLPLTENMISADPVRVGDVLTMRDGTTVEIRNADAEGRLILADALILAAESQPDAIVDIATLTDAAAVALGRKIAALMSTDDVLASALTAAADRAGEPLWRLPLPPAYRSQLSSRVADLVNYTSGTRHGTALLAGLFLREFVPGGLTWAHLDIQGTALCDADDGEWVAGGTGFGVRTLIEFLTGGIGRLSRLR